MITILKYIKLSDIKKGVDKKEEEFKKLPNLKRITNVYDKGIQSCSAHNGYVYNTAAQIEIVLGKAVKGEDKSKFSWYCQVGDLYFTIYDYKSYPKNKKVVDEYHIGCKDNKTTEEVIDLLKSCGLHAYKREWYEDIPNKE